MVSHDTCGFPPCVRCNLRSCKSMVSSDGFLAECPKELESNEKLACQLSESRGIEVCSNYVVDKRHFVCELVDQTLLLYAPMCMWCVQPCVCGVCVCAPMVVWLPYSRIIRHPSLISAASLLGAALLLDPVLIK